MSIITRFLLLLVALLLGCSSDSAPARDGGVDAGPSPLVASATALGWTDETAARGLGGISSPCRTVSFADLDGDGAPDLIVPRASAVDVYRNDGAGHFGLWTSIAVPELAQAQLCATAVADLDGDGRRDIAVGVDHAPGLSTGVAVLFNDGGGAFSVVSATAPLDSAPLHDGGAPPAGSVFVIGVATGEASGPLLFLGNSLDGAAGSLDFNACGYDALGINVQCPSPVPGPNSLAYRVPSGTRALVPVIDSVLNVHGNVEGLGIYDVDGDGADDILVGVDFSTQVVLHATGATYEDRSAAWGVNHFAHGMGIALGDVDEDGTTDAVFSTVSGFIDYQGLVGGGFAARGESSAYSTRRRDLWPWSALFLDLDNNGHLDLIATNEWAHHGSDPLHWIQMIGGPADFVGEFNTVIFQDSARSYREGYVPYETILAAHGRPKNVAVADLDGDGRLELAMLMLRAADSNAAADLVVGQIGGAVGHGLTVRLGGRAGQGTRVFLTCGGRAQMREIYGAEGMGAAARTEAHFGCGAVTTYEALRVEPRGLAAIDLPGGKLDSAVFVKVP